MWFTGLSGSGKSSVAMLVEQKLLEKGVPAYVLDGDNLRHGLNADLGFSMADRAENQRRLAHVAAILADSGQVVLVPAISPLEEHRALARQVTTEAGLDFFEVFCDTPLEDCERRDPKGLYAKARAGEITHFTGIDSPYQRPKNPDLRLTPDRDAGGAGRHGDRAAGKPAVSDHDLAAGSPTAAGELLLDVRAELADATAAERKAAGDKRSHDFLMAALAAERPDDAVLSEEGCRRPGPADRRPRVDRRPARRHPRVLRARPRRLGGARRAVAGRRTGRRCGRASRRRASRWPRRTVAPRPPRPTTPRIVVSRTRPPAIALAVRDALDGALVEMGSAGAKVASVVQGRPMSTCTPAASTSGTSAAPVAVARAAGLHTSRIDGSPLVYNRPDPLLPDLIVCRPELADAVLAVTRD